MKVNRAKDTGRRDFLKDYTCVYFLNSVSII